MKTEFDIFKIFFFMVFLLIVGLFAFRVTTVTKATKDGKKVYEISVNNFQHMESYITSEYTRDEKTGCISFKDEFGLKHVVCNNYTITEY